MNKLLVSLLIATVAVMLPQGAQAQQAAQAMTGMEMQKSGGETKPDTAKAAAMSCCCSKKEDTAKKTEQTAQPVR